MRTVVVSRARIMLLAVIMEGAALAMALIFSHYFHIRLFPLSVNLLRDVIIGLAGALALFVFFLMSVSARAENVPVIGTLRKIVVTDIKAVFSNAHLIDLLVISCLAGYAEELLFRGIVQVKLGILAASIIFGLFHAISPAYAVVTMVMGLYIGLIYNLSGHLFAPILVHALYDFGALVCLRYCIQSEEENSG